METLSSLFNKFCVSKHKYKYTSGFIDWLHAGAIALEPQTLLNIINLSFKVNKGLKCARKMEQLVLNLQIDFRWLLGFWNLSEVLISVLCQINVFEKNEGCFVINVENDENIRMEMGISNTVLNTHKIPMFCNYTQTQKVWRVNGHISYTPWVDLVTYVLDATSGLVSRSMSVKHLRSTNLVLFFGHPTTLGPEQ